MMTFIGGKEVDWMFQQLRIVLQDDTYISAITTVQTNQAIGEFKLMREMPQVGSSLNGGLRLMSRQIVLSGQDMMPS